MTTRITTDNITDATIGTADLASSVPLNTQWQSVITADGSTSTTAVAGEGYFIDTTSAAHTINLPASPTQGDEVTIVDYAGTFGTNNVTVNRNGSKLDGATANATLATNRLSSRFVYIDATQGWRAILDDTSTDYGPSFTSATGGTVTTSGDYKIHSFTGDGCFVVSSVGNPVGGGDGVDYVVVAGGGGGGAGSSHGGGGGAGGYRESHSTPVSGCYTASPLASGTSLTVTATTYPITVGGGGSGVGSNNQGGAGSNSTFSTITSTGGGGGGAWSGIGGASGGSGGGAGTPGGAGASGNTPPVSPPQGNPGGPASPSGPFMGGGGGAGEAGSTDGNGTGGDGVITNITGSPITYSGGGSAGVSGGDGAPLGGGDGGGGQGGNPGPGGNGGANQGGGGGGNGPSGTPSGAGGKGIVIIRYKYQ